MDKIQASMRYQARGPELGVVWWPALIASDEKAFGIHQSHAR
jgi:hypothetical protein